VEASFVGYVTQRKPIKLRTFNQIDFALEPDVVNIEEITVCSDVNPALLILREVINRREQNDPARFNSYHCRTYTKMQLDLNNIKDSFRSKRLQRNFGFVFDYADTSALTGERALPVMISETTAELYSRREPELRREIILANRTSGVNLDVGVVLWLSLAVVAGIFLAHFIKQHYYFAQEARMRAKEE
jgi:hypothetical protein